ncbi:hypothetical protein AWB65_06933 [Caballeronia humi]|uniref:Uncharacterized protein n=1 Tax=Caballeronia humi TaxID=326474 RepID=A0A158JQE4_9BURK|nr:hypothetical protein AWB65_06933 [Caballeronia humi]
MKVLAMRSAPPDSSSRPPSIVPRPTTSPTELRMPPKPFSKLLMTAVGASPAALPRKPDVRISARNGCILSRVMSSTSNTMAIAGAING